MYALNNQLTPDQINKLKFYYTDKDVSKYEMGNKLVKTDKSLRRLTTIKIHQILKKKAKELEESYPQVRLFIYIISSNTCRGKGIRLIRYLRVEYKLILIYSDEIY